MDRKLLDILACPATRQPLALLESRGLDALNRAIVAGGIRRTDDSPQSESLREALVTRDRKLVYRIDDGIPVATFAIGNAGAANAALFAAAMLAHDDAAIAAALAAFREKQTDDVAANDDPRQ